MRRTPWGYHHPPARGLGGGAAAPTTRVRAHRPRRLGRRTLRVRDDAADRDEFGPDGRLYVAQEAGQILVVGVGSARNRASSRAGSPRRSVWRGRATASSCPRRTTRQPHALRQAARQPQGTAEEPPERPPPAGQRRRRPRRPSLSRQRLDVRRLRREEPAERDDPLGPPGRPRPRGRRDGAAQPVRARRRAADRTPVRHRQRTRRPRERREPAEMLVRVEQGRDFGWPDCWPNFAEKRLTGGCSGVTPPVAVPRAALGRRQPRVLPRRANRVRRALGPVLGRTAAPSSASASRGTGPSPASACSHAASATRSRSSSPRAARSRLGLGTRPDLSHPPSLIARRTGEGEAARGLRALSPEEVQRNRRCAAGPRWSPPATRPTPPNPPRPSPSTVGRAASPTSPTHVCRTGPAAGPRRTRAGSPSCQAVPRAPRLAAPASRASPRGLKVGLDALRAPRPQPLARPSRESGRTATPRCC